jgi:hypothetical protein
MNDILSENVTDLHSRANAGAKAIGERMHSATAATGDPARQAWSQAGDAAEDFVEAGHRATRSVSRQIHENPLISVLVGIAFAGIASLWFRGGGSTAKAPSPRRSRVTAPPKKAVSR